MAQPFPGLGLAQKPAAPGAAGRPAVKAAAGMGSPSGRGRLQFLLDIAQATFAQPGAPTVAQIEALRRTLSAVPLEELGLDPDRPPQSQQGAAPPSPRREPGPGSSSSSRSSSPGLSDGTHALLARERARGSFPPAGPAALAPRPPITYMLIYEDARVSLGVFCLPARAKIPLHNHPGMTVLSRVLYGRMHVSSYDWADGRQGGAAPLPREARLVMDATLGAGDSPAVLFPHAGGNIHEFTALTDCAVLDLMSPPYCTEDGRDCTYYAVVQGGAPGDAAGGVVRLDAFEPPADFVINQGQYRGVLPRPKLGPPSPPPGSAAAERSGEASPTGGDAPGAERKAARAARRRAQAQAQYAQQTDSPT